LRSLTTTVGVVEVVLITAPLRESVVSFTGNDMPRLLIVDKFPPPDMNVESGVHVLLVVSTL
jgi:hypothetical protein